MKPTGAQIAPLVFAALACSGGNGASSNPGGRTPDMSQSGSGGVRADSASTPLAYDLGSTPPGSARLIAFTRGLDLPQIIDRITVRAGGEIWLVDPDQAGSARKLVADSGAASMMPAWGPDRSRLVFASNRGRSDHRYLDLWVIGVGREDPKRLTTANAHDWTPAWSPDGRTIAYATTVGKSEPDEVWGLDVWLIDADGSNPRALYQGPGQDEDPVFSRDSKTVYFVSAQPDSRACTYQLWKAQVDEPSTAEALKDASGQVVCGEDVSAAPDGSFLLFSVGGQLGRYEIATRGITLLGYNEEPWVSPDGGQVTYINNFNVAVADLDGGNARDITTGGKDFFPRW